jgi:CheY-like chemotaxis protein
VRPCRVLLVEDDDDIRETLAEILLSEGYGVQAARNGREALEVLRREPLPGVILLDLRMPVMDGFEFRSHQLRDARLRRVPVLVLTAANDPRDESAETSDMATCGHLRKPIDLETLLATVARCCGDMPAMQAVP